MVNQVWGKHSTVVTGSQDGSKQISKNEWNENLNRKGLLGFDSETIASASSVTIPDDSSDDVSSFIKLSGSTSVDTLVTTNTSDGDLLFIITTGSVTLNNTSSPSSAGDIRLLGNANLDLSTTVPTILMRVGNFWYEYGLSGTILAPAIVTSSLTTVGALNSGSITSGFGNIDIGSSDFDTSGTVTCDVTGDVSGSSGSCTGNSATATALETARTIGGTSFDGTGNIAITTNANLTGDVTSSGNATTIATDAVDIAMLSATGTASSTTYLRGDNTWSTAGGAALDADNTWTGNQNFNSFIQSMSTILTISSAAVTATRSTHRLETEGAASTDTMTHMNGYDYGRIVILTTQTSGHDVTLQDEAGGSGTLNMAGDFTLDNNNDSIMFCGRLTDGATFMEISRSNNG